MSDAVRILLKRVISDQAFPLELKVPNAQTRAAMEEARTMVKARAARFDSAPTPCSMTSKKPARVRRAALPRASDYAKSFRKVW